MDKRKTGIMVPAVLAGFCLAAALGCSGKNHYTQPDVPGFVGTSQVTVGTTVYQEAAVGDRVVINGSSFSGITTVSFAGQPSLDFSVTGSGQIVAVVPDMAITGPITVQNPAGIGTSYASLVVTPAITGIEFTWNAAGTSLLATLTGTGFYNASSLAFGAETPGQPGATTFTYINPDQMTAVVGTSVTPGSATVTLTTSVLEGSNADGTAATAVPVTATTTVTVPPAPAA